MCWLLVRRCTYVVRTLLLHITTLHLQTNHLSNQPRSQGGSSTDFRFSNMAETENTDVEDLEGWLELEYIVC